MTPKDLAEMIAKTLNDSLTLLMTDETFSYLGEKWQHEEAIRAMLDACAANLAMTIPEAISDATSAGLKIRAADYVEMRTKLETAMELCRASSRALKMLLRTDDSRGLIDDLDKLTS